MGKTIFDHIQKTPLIDHHVHSLLDREITFKEFENFLTESPFDAPAGSSHLFSQVGFALRRHCAPVFGLEAHIGALDYFKLRSQLGREKVAKMLLRNSNVSHSLIDTGHLGGEQLANWDVFSHVSNQQAFEVTRIESLAECILEAEISGDEFPTAFRAALERTKRHSVGFKSIIAYRFGFDFSPCRPSDEDVSRAVDSLSSATRSRIQDATILRFLLWETALTGLPLQLHVGYGDPDLDLHRANPALLMPWLRKLPSASSPIMLLHCYPYHREAGYLAQVFPNVYFDVGLGINYSGAASQLIIREALELAPFSKLLYSSDAWGLPELHFLGAILWRKGLAKTLEGFVQSGEWSLDDAFEVATHVCRENARKVYQL